MDLYAVLAGPEWKVNPDAFDPAGILHEMETTAEALRPRLLAVHRACQGSWRPTWLGPAAKLVEDVAWMMNSWGGLALACDIDWSNHEKEFTSNVSHLERNRSALRESIKEGAPVPGVRVPHYNRGTAKSPNGRRAVATLPIPMSRATRRALSAGAVLVGIVGLLAVSLSKRDNVLQNANSAREAAAPATLPSWTAPAVPVSPPITAPELTSASASAASSAMTVPARSAAPVAKSPRTSVQHPSLPQPQRVTPERVPQPLTRAAPPRAPGPRLAGTDQASTGVLSLAVDPPAYGPDRVTTSLVVRVTTTGPGRVTVELISADSPWRGMLGWGSPSLRMFNLAGQTSYVVQVPFNIRNYCGTASGFKYWGAMVTTSPLAPNREVYVDLPAIC